jgi:hypothetical protein
MLNMWECRVKIIKKLENENFISSGVPCMEAREALLP